MRNSIPFAGRDADHDSTCAALERLAETSPHLLLDIGFREDRQARADVTTWRRGDLRVDRVRAPGAQHLAFRTPRP